ncbi:MAG: hypothetical protein IPM53_13965 [Anaerolineaceae bacterium]|nr:hypothetical protein [Anaerolineaceae bacterium]
MALEDRVRELEEELKVLKNEIQTTLLDIQEQILSHYYPSLYPSANKEANLAQVNIARHAAEAAAAQAAPAAVPAAQVAPAQAAVPAQAAPPPVHSHAPVSGAVQVNPSAPSYNGKYKTQTVTLVEEPEESDDGEPEPLKEEAAPKRLAVVPQTTHKKPSAAANGHMPDDYLDDFLPQRPEAEGLSAEDEAFLDAIVAKERGDAKDTAVSFDEFKNLVQQKAPDTNLEEESFTEALLNELLKDSLTDAAEAHLSLDDLFADPEPHESGNNVNRQAVKSTVRKLLNWVDESVSVIGKDPTKQAIAMYVRAGDVSGEMREALMLLVDSSHVEPATEKAGIRQIIDTLGELNDILDHHSPEYLNTVMSLITEVNFG